MKIVVIGASGLIGTRLVKMPRERGARYFSTEVNDQSLTPGDNPRVGTTRFDEWLSRSAPSH
jgi:uncharacterized protein YbjT (DUF2867 family)